MGLGEQPLEGMIGSAPRLAAVDQQPHLDTDPPKRTDDLEDDGGCFAPLPFRGFASPKKRGPDQWGPVMAQAISDSERQRWSR